MVEFGLAPAIRVMAISAFLTKLAIVCVVFGMTVIAGMVCFSILAVFLMTSITVGLLMLARQFIIGEPMVEFIFVQPDYPGIGPLVIAVAGFAIQAAGVFVFTVEALLVAYIQSHRFMVMTAKTEFFLCRIAHSNMAICTL